MENIKSFDKFYESELVPEIAKQEDERKRFKKKFLAYLIGVYLVFYFIYSWIVDTYYSDVTTVPVFWILTFIILIPFLVWYNSFRKKFSAVYKDGVIKKIIHYIDDSLTYQALNKFPKMQYLKSGIFNRKPDRYTGEDLVKGKIEDTYVTFSEVHSEYKTSGGKDNDTKWHTIFKGVFFEADFNKDFNTKTYILADYLERSFGYIGKKLQSLNTERPPLVKLEDPEFEKYFAVYGEDQVEARYILSTSLMQRLTDFRKKRKWPIALSFVDNSIFIAITEYKNLFEPRIFKTNLDKKLTLEYYSMLELVIGIVDDLNLNNRIWAGSKMKTE